MKYQEGTSQKQLSPLWAPTCRWLRSVSLHEDEREQHREGAQWVGTWSEPLPGLASNLHTKSHKETLACLGLLRVTYQICHFFINDHVFWPLK